MNSYSNQIRDAIFNIIGSSITDVNGASSSINSRMEAHPLAYLLDNRAKLPAVYLNPINFPLYDYDEFPQRCVQTYTMEIYYVMTRDETQNPYETSRWRAEAIAKKLDQTHRLGLTFTDDTQIWWSRLGRLMSETQTAAIIRELKQPYGTCMFTFEVRLDTDLD